MFRISRITAPRATLCAFLLLAAAMFGLGSLASHLAAAHPPVAAADAVERHGSAHGSRHGPPCAATEEVAR